ncbi:MAG: hypothetical protein HY702_04705 [Gemmatimonadetes bacterium]|nr:hypothetical protein [Gemmatimonadota bacterium]
MADRDPLSDAYWLPGLEARDHDGFEEVTLGEWVARVPRLRPEGVRRIAGELIRAGEERLERRPVADILDAVAAAARSITASDSDLRVSLERSLPLATGYAPAMVRLGLDRMAQDWRADVLRQALVAEFGDPEVLDRPRPRRDALGKVRAFGPRLVAHIFAGNVPGVSVTSLVRALLVKAASFGKTASGEPLAAVAFARALSVVDEGLGRCLAVTYWPGGSESLESALFESAEAVIAYGSDASVDAVRARVPPRTLLIAYPHRVGVALVEGAALRADLRELALKAARDVAVFDQQGCVAPHCVYVEAEPGLAETFADALATALARVEEEWPRGRVSAAEAAAIHELRAQMEFRGARVWASPEGTGWTVILDPEPTFTPSPLNRVVFVKPVRDLRDALAALEPVRWHLQSVGLAAGGERYEALAESLGRLGASRVVPLGSMAWPEPQGHADGRFQFLDLVRFVDIPGVGGP